MHFSFQILLCAGIVSYAAISVYRFGELLLQRNDLLGNIALRFQGNIAHFPARRLSAAGCPGTRRYFAGQFLNHHIAGQGLTVCLAAHNLYVDITAVVRNSAKQYPVISGVDFFAVSIDFAGINPLAHRRDVYAFNILFCIQIDLARGNGIAAGLADAAAGGFHRNHSVLGGALNIAVQFDVAAFLVGILDSNAAVAVVFSEEAHFDILVRRYGEGVALGGFFGFGPSCMVRGVRPERPPIAAFLPAVGFRISLGGLPVIPNDAEFRSL